jgi:hypothetical protein
MSSHTKAAIVTVSGVIGLVLVLYLIRDRGGFGIRLVLPNGFEGVVWVVPNAPNGVRAVHREGRLTFVVPADGLLRIRNDPFSRWHSLSAQYENGQELVYANDREGPIVVEHSSDEHHIVIFVGPVRTYDYYRTHRFELEQLSPGAHGWVVP